MLPGASRANIVGARSAAHRLSLALNHYGRICSAKPPVEQISTAKPICLQKKSKNSNFSSRSNLSVSNCSKKDTRAVLLEKAPFLTIDSKECILGFCTSAANNMATLSPNRHIVRVPPLGDSITEGDVCEWKKNVGDFVQQDEIICVIETDKVSVEIHADVSGVLVSQVVEEGGTAMVGGDLAMINTQAEVFPAQNDDGSSSLTSNNSNSSNSAATAASTSTCSNASSATLSSSSTCSLDPPAKVLGTHLQNMENVKINTENIDSRLGTPSGMTFRTYQPRIRFTVGLRGSKRVENIIPHGAAPPLKNLNMQNLNASQLDSIKSALEKNPKQVLTSMPSKDHVAQIRKTVLSSKEVDAVNIGGDLEDIHKTLGKWTTVAHLAQ